MHRISLLLLLFLLLTPALGAAQESALTELRTAARAAPRDYAAQHALGDALLEAGHYREAAATLRRASRLQRGDVAALYEVARVAFAQREYRQARGQCRTIARQAPDNPIAHVCMARAWIAWNRSARAFEELEAALASNPNDYESLLALGDAHRLRAAVAESEAAYRRAIAASASESEPHLGLGMLYAQAHRSDDAIRELRAAHALNDDDPDVDYELGRALSGHEAVGHLRDAVANRPGWSRARAELGNALLDVGDHEHAIEELRAAARADSNLVSARSGLGRALIAAGNFEEAESTFRAVLEQVPNDGDSVVGLADVFARTDRNEEAYEQYRHAADLDRRNPDPLVRAARLALTQQRPVLAMGFLQRVISQSPSWAPALALMGDVMRTRRQGTQARDFYRRALRGEGEIDRAAVEASLRRIPGAR